MRSATLEGCRRPIGLFLQRSLKASKNIRLLGSSLERYVHVSEEEGASCITLFGSYPMILMPNHPSYHSL